MLRSTHDLHNYSIGATDGPIGNVKDFYFDDDAWVIRYLVVETGSWLLSRRVLISPISLHDPDWVDRTLPASITMAQVRDSPDIETDKPLSRQHETKYLGYYGYPNYWGGAGMWGSGMYPYALMPGYIGYGMNRAEREREEEAYRVAERDRRSNEDPHLRSCKEVVGYHLHASDGEIGHVEDFLLDDETWAIRYIIVNTSNWWMGHKVLIAPHWITGASWTAETLTVDLTQESIKAAPPYESPAAWGAEQDLSLHEHYGGTGTQVSRPRLASFR